MVQGILILGLNGCGKSTIGRMLAEELGYFRMDNEDYFFPTPGDFAHARPEAEVHQLMEADVLRHGRFVLSCVRCNLSDAIVEKVGLTVVLRADPETRAGRIQQREERRFGRRVLPGGDLYESQQAFHAFAASRTEETVNQTLDRLQCPILEMDAALAPAEIVQKIRLAWESNL